MTSTGKQSPTVAVVVERRYLGQVQPRGLIGSLRARGVEVRVVEADGCAVRVDAKAWPAGVDVVVMRGRSTAALVAAARAEASGIPTLNSRAATESVRNKAEQAIALASAGIPCPPTLVGTPAALAAELTADEYPVLLKPVFGDNCRGLRLVAGPRELCDTAWPEPVALAQPFVASDGRDLKLYAIGAQVFAVRKPSPFRARSASAGLAGDAAVPAPVTPALRALALRCGRLFGLELFGVDCIEGPAGPLVIEVNEFPNYTGVAGADDLLAELVLARAARSTACCPHPIREAWWSRRSSLAQAE